MMMVYGHRGLKQHHVNAMCIVTDELADDCSTVLSTMYSEKLH